MAFSCCFSPEKLHVDSTKFVDVVVSLKSVIKYFLNHLF